MSQHLYWEEFAEVTVRRLVNPGRGEPFLIITDTFNDLSLAEACLAAGIRAGADTQLMVKPRLAAGAPSRPGPILSEAIIASKYILEFCGGIVRAPATLEARKRGTRVLSTYLKGIEEYAIRGLLDIDVDAMIRDAQRMADMWNNADIARVTSRFGTDVSFQMKPRKTQVVDGALSEDGEVDFFPGAQLANAPVEDTINGVIVVDAVDSQGIIKTPYAMTLKNGVIVGIEGGREADIIRNWLEACKDEKVYRLCHFCIGLNPAARVTLNPLENERVMGAIDFGFGYQDPSFGGTIGFSPYHWDVLMASPSLYLDDRPVSTDGKLDPDLGFEVTTSRHKRV